MKKEIAGCEDMCWDCEENLSVRVPLGEILGIGHVLKND
jgi:hypothetical protein